MWNSCPATMISSPVRLSGVPGLAALGFVAQPVDRTSAAIQSRVNRRSGATTRVGLITAVLQRGAVKMREVCRLDDRTSSPGASRNSVEARLADKPPRIRYDALVA